MIIAARFERARRLANIGWGGGIAAAVALTALLWPSIEGTDSFDDVIEDLPATVRAMIGAQGAVPLGTPAGYLNARIFATVLPVLLTVYGIGIGARALAGSDDDGTLEMILANPVSRRSVAIERGLSAAGFIVTLGAVAFVFLLAFGAPVGLLDRVSVARMLAACGGVTALAVFHSGISFAAGAATGRPSVAVGAAATVAAAGYLLTGLLATTDDLQWLRAISPWHRLLARNVLAVGTPAVPIVIEIVVAGSLAVAGVRRFTTRALR